MKGRRLFDEVFTVYGPVYFAWQWGIRTALGLSPSDDTARAITLVLWLAATACTGLALWRLTRSRSLTALGSLLAPKLGGTVAGQPGHPQDVITFANAGILAGLTSLEGGGL